MESQQYQLPHTIDVATLLDGLEQRFQLKPVRNRIATHQYLDTFDWRLYKKGWHLRHDGQTLHLHHRKPSQPTYQLNTAVPPFAWDLPNSDLKTKITPILAMRRLLPQLTLNVETTYFNALNTDEKTVIRLQLDDMTLADAPNAPPIGLHLTLHPLRGYDKAASQLIKVLTQLGATAVSHYDHFRHTLTHANKKPGHYQAKPTLPLTPTMPAQDAVRQLLLSDLNVMQINQPYIGQDIDTEFLHDYRVALRRSRAALSQMRGVFPTAETARAKTALKQLNTLTNELRDLDVYLLAEAEYRTMLPDTLQTAIDPLFYYLHGKRKTALKTTSAALKTNDYQHTINQWHQFLNQQYDNAPNATRPIIELANERIYKRYRRILKNGRRILTTAKDEEMHDLRLECKKLRYLMEFFTALYPPQEIGPLITQLKKLQTNLGNFNDYCVQEEYLLAITDELPATKGKSRQTILAIGALIATIHEKRLRSKAKFATIFADFAAPDNQQRFKQLFKPQKGDKA